MTKPADRTGDIELPTPVPTSVPKRVHRDYLAELDARIAHCQTCARRRLNPHQCTPEP